MASGPVDPKQIEATVTNEHNSYDQQGQVTYAGQNVPAPAYSPPMQMQVRECNLLISSMFTSFSG